MPLFPWVDNQKGAGTRDGTHDVASCPTLTINHLPLQLVCRNDKGGALRDIEMRPMATGEAPAAALVEGKNST